MFGMWRPNLILRSLNVYAASIITNSDTIRIDSKPPTLVGRFPSKYKYLEKHHRHAAASFLLSSWFNFLGLVVKISDGEEQNEVEISGIK